MPTGLISSTPLVEQFFEKWHDASLGELIARAFRGKYETFRLNMTPNRIFEALQDWAGGSERGSAEHEMAVLTILAYYFERCDIFEEPREVLL